MDNYSRSAVTIQSFSFRKMHRRVREAIRSTEVLHERFQSAKAFLPATLRYKQFRQPVSRLNLSPALRDRLRTWPKNPRYVNHLRAPVRTFGTDRIVPSGKPLSLPLCTQLRKINRLSRQSRTLLQISSREFTRPSLPRAIVTPTPPRRYQGSQLPLRSVTKDFSYLYDTRSGKSTTNSALGLKSRLLAHTSTYAFPILCDEDVVTPKTSTRLAERLYNIYANKTLELDTCKQVGLHSRAQFSGCRDTQTLTKFTRSYCPSIRQTTAYVSPVGPPKTLPTRVGRWSKPFLPNSPIGPGRTSPRFRSRLDDVVTTKYIGLPQTSLRVRDTELASLYKPQLSTCTDLGKQTSMSSSCYRRRCATRSEALPVSSDIGLRLRLSLRMSSSGMAHLYPRKDALLLSPQPISKNSMMSQRSSDRETSNLSTATRTTTATSFQHTRLHQNSSKMTTSTSFTAPTARPPTISASNKCILKPLPSPRRVTNNYDHLYPTNPPKSLNYAFGLRPLPGTDLKLKTSRLNDRSYQTRANVDEDDDLLATSTGISSARRLLSSATNYSHLYVAHPENLPTSELGQRLNLSLRSSTSKIASLYASHPTSSFTPPAPLHRLKRQPSRHLSEKYFAHAYAPRPGIVRPKCMA